MKALKLLAAAFAAALALAAVSPQALAHGRVRGGVTFHFGYHWPGYGWGPGYWGPRYRYLPPPLIAYDEYDPYFYGPPVVVHRPDPPEYIERDPPAVDPALAEPPAWWYWCPSAKAYYPYVKQCPGGWQRVPPQPTPPERR